MIVPFVITVLLGASLSSGMPDFEPPVITDECKNVHDFFYTSTKMSPGSYRSVKITNAANNVIYKLKRMEYEQGHRFHADAYVVQDGQQIIPQVTMNGKTYELHNFNFVPNTISVTGSTATKGSAFMTLNFSLDRTPLDVVAFLIPLVLDNKGDINTALEAEFSKMVDVSAKRVTQAGFNADWLQKHLSKAQVLTVHKETPHLLQAFLTDCITISANAVLDLFPDHKKIQTTDEDQPTIDDGPVFDDDQFDGPIFDDKFDGEMPDLITF